MSVINDVVEAAIGMMNATTPFATVTRGALPTGDGLSCEVSPGIYENIFLDKNRTISMELTLNGKHSNLKTLSDAMNNIHSALTRATAYPSGEGWHITDILNGTFPAIIGRENDNRWLMASSLSIRFYWKGD